MRLRHDALAVLLMRDPEEKAAAARALHAAWMALPSPVLAEPARLEALTLDAAQQAAMPGRPERPTLVSATKVPSRSPFTLEGRAALLHAICHIEFNAIKSGSIVSVTEYFIQWNSDGPVRPL